MGCTKILTMTSTISIWYYAIFCQDNNEKRDISEEKSHYIISLNLKYYKVRGVFDLGWYFGGCLF